MTLAPLLAHWRERPQRTWSVVVTVFGDAIVPRGGSVWLAPLIEPFAALGVDAGAVRTAMSRLVADGWTERQRAGRNSSYALTAKGMATFTAAADRIYAAAPPAWDGRFRLVMQPEDRAALAREGFGQPLPGLWITAQPAQPEVGLVLEATASPDHARRLAEQAWPLGRLAESFTRFTQAFAALPNWADPAPLDAMVARTLLIHEYRRVVLHAPALPADILPPNWPGTAARSLCANAYAALLPASEAWLAQHGLPRSGAEVQARFHLQPPQTGGESVTEFR